MSNKKKKEEGAPAYMIQFTSLMTILLAFFICMLTMGKEKTSEYKTGFGYVRDAFGFSGGVGMLSFWKAVMSSYPRAKESDDGKARNLLGFRKGAFTKGRFEADESTKLTHHERSRTVQISSPILFPPGSSHIDEAASKFLDQLGSVFLTTPEQIVTVCSYQDHGAPDPDIRIASRRATAVSRYLVAQCKLPRDRIHSVGFSHTRYLGDIEDNQATLFLVRRDDKLTTNTTME